MGETSRQVQIVNKRGLHARASAKFVSAVAELENCQVTVRKDAHNAAGGSILGLMMLGAAKGDTIEITVSGINAALALKMLTDMVEDGFGED